jgi:hypothetical protein
LGLGNEGNTLALIMMTRYFFSILGCIFGFRKGFQGNYFPNALSLFSSFFLSFFVALSD